METKPYNLQAPEAIAKEYGGNKQAIARAAQAGLVDPTAAVLAGMFIDRMRNAASQEQVPQQTVAQQVFTPPASQMPAGLGATPEAQQMPQMAAPAPSMPAPGMANGGLASLPVDESMFPDEYAGGGIVAFAGGGLGSTFDPFAPSDSQDDEFSSYQPMFPFLGEGNRRYALKQLGYTNEQILRMPVAQQEFVLRNVQKAGAQPPAATPAAPIPGPAATPAAVPSAAPKLAPKAPAAAAPVAPAPALPATAKELTPEAYKAQQAAFGIAEDPMAETRAKIASMAGESKLDREFAKNMALVQAGLSIMGGTSPYALTNIGKGASEAVATYSKDLKDIKSAERDLFKMQTELAKAEDAQKRGDFKAYQDHISNANKLAIDLKKLEYQARSTEADERKTEGYLKSLGKPSQFREQYELYSADEKAAGRRPTFEGFRKALGSSDETAMLSRQRYADAALAQDGEYLRYSMSKKPEDQKKAQEIRARKYREYGVTSIEGPSSDPLGLRGGR